jgi:uncharacterized caspase-like protein
MIRLFRLLALIAVGIVAVHTSATGGERRIALVVGNSSYQHAQSLVNATNDAKLVASTLHELGFTIVGESAQIDLDKAAFDKAVRQFGKEAQASDVALFYYAGHGVQIHGTNFLVPIDAVLASTGDIDFELVDASVLLRQMEASGTRLKIVILDACRNNPFGGRGLRAVEHGLAQMQAPEGTLISFATQPGNVALDGSGGHSPYTTALAQVLRRPGIGVFDAFNEVGLSVKRTTGGFQIPWVSSSPIDGTFILREYRLQPPPQSPTRNFGHLSKILQTVNRSKITLASSLKAVMRQTHVCA